MHKGTDIYVTSYNIQRKKNMYLYDNEVQNLKKQFLEAEECFKFTGKNEDKIRTAELKKTYDLKLKELRKTANADRINNSTNKAKAIWDTINQERNCKNTKDSLIECVVVNGRKINNPNDIANHFNMYYSSIVDKILGSSASNNTLQVTQLDTYENLLPMSQIHPTTEDELLSIINKLKSKTSAGIDEISSKTVKFCAKEFILPLCHIANLSFYTGEFPSKLKISKIVPIYKKDRCDAVENYRPISLVSTFSKIIEKVVLARLLHHLDHNNLLSNNQHGFLQGKSTLTALVDIVEYIYDCLEAGKSIISVFLDLSKAFDSLNHELTLNKLNLLGINGPALSWFKSYLTGSHQLVEVRQNISGQITSGRSNLLSVQRGPERSPTLFILFVNDF